MNKENEIQAPVLPNASLHPKQEPSVKFALDKKIEEIPKEIVSRNRPTSALPVAPNKVRGPTMIERNASSVQLVMRFMTPLEAKNYVLENGKKELEDQAKESDQMRNQTYDPWAQVSCFINF